MSKNLYIVPHDFTEVGDAALKYALHVCNKVDVEIRILHLVDNKAKINAASAKIDQLVERLVGSSSIEITKQIQVGTIFEDIGRIALNAGAQLIIMGTHGKQGMQILFGSHAMKVIMNSEVPFLIIQKDTVPRDVKKIVVPINLTKESLQIVKLAGSMATIFGAEVHVVGQKQNDELLNQQMKNRILIVKNQYEEMHVPCHVEFIKDSGSYFKRVMEYVHRNEIDLIATAHYSESLLPQLETFTQNLITNTDKLPCLVINAKQASALYF